MIRKPAELVKDWKETWEKVEIWKGSRSIPAFESLSWHHPLTPSLLGGQMLPRPVQLDNPAEPDPAAQEWGRDVAGPHTGHKKGESNCV